MATVSGMNCIPQHKSWLDPWVLPFLDHIRRLEDTNTSKRCDGSQWPKTWNSQRQQPGKFLWKLFLNSSSQSPYSYLQTANNTANKTANNTGFYFRYLWKIRDKEQLWVKLFWANLIDLKLPMKISFLTWQESTAEIQGKNRLQKEQVFSFQLYKTLMQSIQTAWVLPDLIHTFPGMV